MLQYRIVRITIFWCCLLSRLSFVHSATWLGSAGGEWLDDANWTTTAPDGVNERAIFSSQYPSEPGGHSVTIARPVQLGILRISSDRPITIDGPILFERSSDVPSQIDLRSDVGRLAIASPIELNSSLQVDVAAGGQVSLSSVTTADGTQQLIKRLEGALVFSDPGTFVDAAVRIEEGSVQIDSSITLAQLLIDGGDLTGRDLLSVLGDIELRRGTVDMANIDSGISGPGALVKRGFTTARLVSAGSRTSVPIEVESGVLHSQNPGSPFSDVSITSANHAVLRLDRSTFDTIKLNDATGFAYHGGLFLSDHVEISGQIHLGDNGGIIASDGATFSGPFMGGDLRLGGRLTVVGDSHEYTGSTQVGTPTAGTSGPRLVLADDGRLATTSEIELVNKSELLLDNSDRSKYLPDRIADHIPIYLNGGTLELRSGAPVDVERITERLGPVIVESADSLIVSPPDATLTIDRLSRHELGTIDIFAGGNVLPGQTADFVIVNPPDIVNDMLPAWIQLDGDFAAYHPISGVMSLRRTLEKATQLELAATNQHVELEPDQQPLTGDRIVSSMVSRGHSIDLNSHTLNIVTGGWILSPGGVSENGDITAGGLAGPGELIVHSVGFDRGEIQIAANIVDNPTGPVGLTISTHTSSGRFTLSLSGQNTYSGAKTVNAGRAFAEIREAIPDRTDLNLHGGSYWINFDSDTPISIGHVSMREFGGLVASSEHTVSINADSYDIQSGTLDISLAGEGQIRKTTPGPAHIMGDNRNYSGSILVEQGSLIVARDPPGSSAWYALGTGWTTILPGGILVNELFIGNTLHGNIHLAGGEVTASTGSGAFWQFDGQLRISDQSTLALYDARKGAPRAGTVAIDSDVSFDNGAALEILGTGTFLLQGPVQLNGRADMHVTEGEIELTGKLSTESVASTLNITGDGVTRLNGVVEIDAGRSLQLLRDEQPMTVPMSASGQRLTGEGTLINDVQLSQEGVIDPGDAVGTFNVDGNVTWLQGGQLTWQLQDPNAQLGEGWDHLAIRDTLSFGLASPRFRVKVEGLDGNDEIGTVESFDPRQPQSWVIATAGELSGFDPGDFEVDATAFIEHNPTEPLSAFAVDAVDNSLILHYLLLPLPGDFNQNEVLDVEDIDLLTSVVISDSNDLAFDLDDNGRVDQEDRRVWIKDLKFTYFGDANLDGMFSTTDLITVLAAGLYEDSTPMNATWATGDWNGDGDFASDDMVAALADGGFNQGPRIAAHSVPEPSGRSLILMGALAFVRLCALLRRGRRFNMTSQP